MNAVDSSPTSHMFVLKSTWCCHKPLRLYLQINGNHPVLGVILPELHVDTLMGGDYTVSEIQRYMQGTQNLFLILLLSPLLNISYPSYMYMCVHTCTNTRIHKVVESLCCLLHYLILSFYFRSVEVCRSHCNSGHQQVEQEVRAHVSYFWPFSSVRLPEHCSRIPVWHKRLETNFYAGVSSERWLWSQCSLGSTQPKNILVWRFCVREHLHASPKQEAVFL